MKKKKVEFIKKPEFPMSIETFRDVSGYSLQQWKQDTPSSFNGIVSVRKYRITVEEIDEPTEVIADRIRMLWRQCNNHYHWRPLEATAARYGVTLDDKQRGVEK